MMSSGVLAFYLSESEDPLLWKAMAQLSQDERTVFFKNALSYMLVSGDTSLPDVAEQGQKASPAREYLFSAPGIYQDTWDSDSEASAYEGSSYEGTSYEDSDVYRVPKRSAGTDNRSDQHGPASGMEWREETRVRNGRHTLSPSQNARWWDAGSGGTQARDAREPFPSGGGSWSRPEGTVRQPELNDVGLEDVFTDQGAPTRQDLRGLDFLLKNVIGEETDEAVMEAIRRWRETVHR